MQCPKCGAEVAEKTSYCPTCGQFLGVTRCPGCGADVTPGAAFCPNCGAELPKTPHQAKDQAANAPQQAQQPQPQQQPTIIINNTNTNTNNAHGAGIDAMTSPKSRWVALALCFFLGEFGVHRFYVGKIGSGILYLCTFGLFGFGWLIDFFTILFGSFRDKYGFWLRR